MPRTAGTTKEAFSTTVRRVGPEKKPRAYRGATNAADAAPTVGPSRCPSPRWRSRKYSPVPASRPTSDPGTFREALCTPIMTPADSAPTARFSGIAVLRAPAAVAKLSGSAAPSRWPSCPTTMMTAVPLRIPAVTGYGMSLMRFPSRARPRSTWRRPLRKTTKKTTVRTE